MDKFALEDLIRQQVMEAADELSQKWELAGKPKVLFDKMVETQLAARIETLDIIADQNRILAIAFESYKKILSETATNEDISEHRKLLKSLMDDYLAKYPEAREQYV